MIDTIINIDTIVDTVTYILVHVTLLSHTIEHECANARNDTNDKMQLPRRVPWATVAELDQLCSWVYAGDAHDSSRSLAIERVRITLSPPKLGPQTFALHEEKSSPRGDS